MAILAEIKTTDFTHEGIANAIREELGEGVIIPCQVEHAIKRGCIRLTDDGIIVKDADADEYKEGE